MHCCAPSRLTRSLLLLLLPQLADFLGVAEDGRFSYEALAKQQDPMRFMVPGVYTTSWFQAMLSGGEYPAPAILAPRIMDNILLDGHIGIVFGLGIAILGYQRDAILKERSEGLASLLKEVCASVPQDRATVDTLLQRAYQLEIKEKHIDAVGNDAAGRNSATRETF